MKIGIIGAGTASAICIMALLRYIRQFNENYTYVECIHNPDINITEVGEGLSVPITYMLSEIINFRVVSDLHRFDGTVRFGTKYFWQKAHGDDFIIDYPQHALHVNSKKFSKYCFEEFNKQYNHIFTEIHDEVINIKNNQDKVIVNGKLSNYEYNYLIDCRGTPDEKDLKSGEYLFPKFESVNSVLIYPEMKNYYEFYTSAYVHENGWMFGIPVQGRKAWGYLYNKNITSEKEALENFSNLKSFEIDTIRKIKWRQYYRKNLMDERIIYMGNRLFFFEPHQSLPLHYYHNITDFFIRNIIIGKKDINDISLVNQMMNNYHIKNIDYIEDLIAINYIGENNIDSEFTNYVKTHAKKTLLESENFINFAKSYNNTGNFSTYGFHPASLMKQYIEGYKINLKEFT
jgi:hypothetical protein